MTALRRTLNLARPDDVYNAIVDAHKGLTDEQCRDQDRDRHQTLKTIRLDQQLKLFDHRAAI